MSAGWILPLACKAEVTSLEVFERIPILHQGRVMPIDSYARQQLLTISGRSHVDRQSAAGWLARTLFNPEQALGDEIFLVNHPEVAEALGLEVSHGRKRYAFSQLQPVLPRLEQLARSAHQLEEGARSTVEQELVRLYSSAVQYYRLQNACTFVFPHPDFSVNDARLKAELQLADTSAALNLLDLVKRGPLIARLVQQNQGVPQADWTPYHQELFRIYNGVSGRLKAADSAGPALIPMIHHQQEHWATPAQALSVVSGESEMMKELTALASMAGAYRAGQQIDFDLAARSLIESVGKQRPDAKRDRNLVREVRYNHWQPFYRAELLYGLAFLAVLICIVSPRRIFYRAAVALLVLALVPHTYGIIARMQIMGRPPVTNLFSTFVFVGWASALLGLALEYLQRNRLGLITAAFSGLALLLVSGRFATEGDTLGVMVAVLDSNFWLATHVVCISLGYAGCVVAGVLGHIYLVQGLFRQPEDARMVDTLRTVYGTLAFGLIFSFFGTMLGGIWADQSWGRFWGWDPKENGALVIVLWSAILFHARLCRMIGARGFAAGSVIGIIWVMLAWLGVNLLGVGLHSYGFTSSLANTLLVVCVLEVVFVVATVPFVKKPAAV
jgi:ABC-type transport system involved in cytochrome c biogenesis permease subunit